MVWLVNDNAAFADSVQTLPQGTWMLRVAPEVVQHWLGVPPGSDPGENLYVVDPLGNAMARFPAQFDGAGAKQMRRVWEEARRADGLAGENLVERVDDGLLVGRRICRGVLGRLEGVGNLLVVGGVVGVAQVGDLADRARPSAFDGLVALLPGPIVRIVDVGLCIELDIGLLEQRDPHMPT